MDDGTIGAAQRSPTDGIPHGRHRRMSEPEMFHELRGLGIDADDPEVRAAVRVACAHVDVVRDRSGSDAARRSLVAMHAALAYRLRHPDIDDMSSFEDDYDEDE